jgi:hypothetical protein
MTLVRGPDEDRVMRASLARLAAFSWPIAIADGGSSREFLDFVRRLPGVSLVDRETAGLVGQVRASLRAAAGVRRPLVFYTEPDKLIFFENHLTDFLHRARLDEQIGLALAARSDEAMRTYPVVQQFTETTFNRACGESLGRPGDYTYGPFLVRASLVRHVDSAANDLGWGWRPYLFAVAHRLGDTLTHVVGDYRCPPEQRLDEEGERIHRMRQLAQNINGLVQGLTL